MSDVFERADNHSSAGRSVGAFEKLFLVKPRLAPMAVVWFMPVPIVLVGLMATMLANERVSADADPGANTGLWVAAMVAVACAPWVLVSLLPAVQRRHLDHPGPFYTFCTWTSIALWTVFPLLWTVVWFLGPGSALSVSVLLWGLFLLYGLVAGLFPWAVRFNHAAWLREKQAKAWP